MKNMNACYPFISVIVPVYNASKTISQLITCLMNQSYPKDKYEIIIVDDGSKDETVEIVMSIAKENSLSNIKIIRLEHNYGPATARNHGVMEAKGQIIAFTDADTLPDQNWLRGLVEAFDDENVGGVRGETLTDSYLLFPVRVASIGGGYKTCNIACRKEVLNNVGLFDERFRHPFGEDGDVAHRVLKKGFLIKDSPKAIVFHPVKELNLKQVMKMAMLRRYDVLFFCKHPENAKAYGERFMRPILVIPPFLGLSISGVAAFLYLVITFISTLFSKVIYFIIDSLIATCLFIPFFILLFLIHGYKTVLYGHPPEKISVYTRVKCAIALLVFYLTALISRIYGSFKYMVLLI
jgi:glycosyltransferase involved in cell wall biosynthesis